MPFAFSSVSVNWCLPADSVPPSIRTTAKEPMLNGSDRREPPVVADAQQRRRSVGVVGGVLANQDVHAHEVPLLRAEEGSQERTRSGDEHWHGRVGSPYTVVHSAGVSRRSDLGRCVGDRRGEDFRDVWKSSPTWQLQGSPTVRETAPRFGYLSTPAAAHRKCKKADRSEFRRGANRPPSSPPLSTTMMPARGMSSVLFDRAAGPRRSVADNHALQPRAPSDRIS